MMANHRTDDTTSASHSTRVHGFDVLRGFSVVSMVLFHCCYDIRYIAGLPLPWFQPPLQDIWRCSISWTFVFIAGCMFAWSRDNLRRSGKYLLVAALVFIITTIVAVDVPINFGIIYCMGSCTLISWALDRSGFKPQGVVAALVLRIGRVFRTSVTLVLFCGFICLLDLAQGTIGVGPLTVAVPRALYQTPYLSWLGLPGPGFASGDYYPTLPYLLLYLAGTAMGRHWRATQVPQVLKDLTCEPLEWIGQHALPIYVLHQPVLLAITMGIVALT